jgi:hypothetical protein
VVGADQITPVTANGATFVEREHPDQTPTAHGRKPSRLIHVVGVENRRALVEIPTFF